jgi:hypothetical protein
MHITLRRAISVLALGAAALSFSAPSRAATYGDEKWCAVTNEGGDNIMWDCEYDNVADCSPAVTQGSRGFCAINPYYQPPTPQPASQPPSLLPPQR